MDAERNCPFYGYALFRTDVPRHASPFMLIGSSGNQCALVADAHSPCMFTVDAEINWKTCPRVGDIQI